MRVFIDGDVPSVIKPKNGPYYIVLELYCYFISQIYLVTVKQEQLNDEKGNIL